MSEKITLDNGVRVVLERIDHVRSASAGIWVSNGSRNEGRGQSGISHFIEHMLFKGTKKRSAAQMAELFDSIGGQSNAFTTKESTAYYVKSLDSHLPLALELLLDMFLEPRFDEEDVNTERGVIFEEIGMYEDSPDDMAVEKLAEAIYAKTALGRPILGTKKSLSPITGADMRAYMEKKYTGPNIVAVISGGFSDSDLDYMKERLSAVPKGRKNSVTPVGYRSARYFKKKAYEQNHVSLAFNGISHQDPRRYAAQVLNNILGGGMSSRLFQRVREQQGLCYTVYSYLNSAYAEGLFGIYTATGKDTEARAIESILSEIEKIKTDGVTEAEFTRAREQIKANLIMGLESTGSRASFLARSELTYGECVSIDEVVRRYDAVSREGLRDLAAEIFDMSTVSLSAVGRVMPSDSYEELISKAKA